GFSRDWSSDVCSSDLPRSRRRADQAGASFGRPRFRVCGRLCRPLSYFGLPSNSLIGERRSISGLPIAPPNGSARLRAVLASALDSAPEITCPRRTEDTCRVESETPGETMNRSVRSLLGASVLVPAAALAVAAAPAHAAPPGPSTTLLYEAYAAAAPVGRVLPENVTMAAG